MEEKLTVLKTKKALPQWYPLKVYKEELNEQQWLDEIAMRVTVKTSLDCDNDKNRVKKLFTQIIINQEYEKGKLASASNEDLSKLWGIRELSSFDATYLSCAIDSSEVGKKLKEQMNSIRSSEDTHSIFGTLPQEVELQKETSFAAAIDWDDEPYPLHDVLSGVPVLVDLDQDDETLIASFKVWLAGVREHLGQSKKPIDEKTFTLWKEYGVLQAFDLEFWAYLNGEKYTNSLIANTIWPYSEVDTTERLRKVTKPKVNELFNDWGYLRRFMRQLEVQNALLDMLDGMKK